MCILVREGGSGHSTGALSHLSIAD